MYIYNFIMYIYYILVLINMNYDFIIKSNIIPQHEINDQVKYCQYNSFYDREYQQDKVEISNGFALDIIHGHNTCFCNNDNMKGKNIKDGHYCFPVTNTLDSGDYRLNRKINVGRNILNRAEEVERLEHYCEYILGCKVTKMQIENSCSCKNCNCENIASGQLKYMKVSDLIRKTKQNKDSTFTYIWGNISLLLNNSYNTVSNNTNELYYKFH